MADRSLREIADPKNQGPAPACQRVLEKLVQPEARLRIVVRLLQFLPDSSDAQNDPGNGSWFSRPRVVN